MIEFEENDPEFTKSFNGFSQEAKTPKIITLLKKTKVIKTDNQAIVVIVFVSILCMLVGFSLMLPNKPGPFVGPDGKEYSDKEMIQLIEARNAELRNKQR